LVEINITPSPQPRMVKSDAWRKRSVVLRYWAYKDELNLLCNKVGYKLGEIVDMVFILPMPKSWTKKEKLERDGKPHQQKPDLDNLEKSICDCLLEDDSVVWKMGAEKRWGKTGKIIFKI
jgi:Holliday junction resolvase RusA-like endonuclease